MDLSYLFSKTRFLIKYQKNTSHFFALPLFLEQKPTKSIFLRYNVGRGEENVCK